MESTLKNNVLLYMGIDPANISEEDSDRIQDTKAGGRGVHSHRASHYADAFTFYEDNKSDMIEVLEEFCEQGDLSLVETIYIRCDEHPGITRMQVERFLVTGQSDNDMIIASVFVEFVAQEVAVQILDSLPPSSEETPEETDSWYCKDLGGDHGQSLVICEKTGDNIAVVYDKKNAHKIAAAPKMQEALADCLAFIVNGPDGCDDTKERVVQAAREALAE